ncbi:MAG: transcription-repair coupling factor, partial [Rhizomicrobium sp.]
MERLDYIARKEGRIAVSGAPSGYDAWLAVQSARRSQGPVLAVLSDEGQVDGFVAAAEFFAPSLTLLPFPAWDCLPYDRVSPKPDVESARLATLAALAKGIAGPALIVASVPAVLQRVPPKTAIVKASFNAAAGEDVDRAALVAFLSDNGYARAGTVRDPGDFALRGGIVDLWPPGTEQPLRLDFFGETLEGIRQFDPQSQLSSEQGERISLLPAGEAPLNEVAIRRFRAGYVASFGPSGDDPLYESVSAGRKAQGMEHWLPLFYERLDTLFDYLPRSLVILGNQVEEAKAARLELISDCYETRERFRRQEMEGKAEGRSDRKIPVLPYKPLTPDALYLDDREWKDALHRHPVRALNPFQVPPSMASVDAGGRQGRDFAPERAAGNQNVFEAAVVHIQALIRAGRRVLMASWTEGSAERMGGVLADHGIAAIRRVENWPEALTLDPSAVAIARLGIERGFEAPDFAIVTEQDILGDRMVRAQSRHRRAQNFLSEISSLAPGDLVTHIEHGVGRYVGLKAIDALGAPHDCLEIQYDGGKLFLPVENVELLTRYGSDEGAVLDRLGGVAWQQRKARMKERVRAIAAELIRVAAARELRALPPVEPPHGLFDEFCARFPYQETEDQEKAIADTIADLARGRPMDRLVCGDVGFGKTEVALRAAFVVAMAGEQVAVVVPTTLLARQHYRAFAERFAGFPIKVRQLSRFVDARQARDVKEALAEGTTDIVVGTHALLSESVNFKRLGLVVVDEEQHFGVTHKERLKSLKADVHVLTLTATPIPRTLQLALSGVRDLSLIATPPVDRLAVRTFVTPFDSLVVREALLREHYRGGQSFFVAPRISDLRDAAAFLKATVPEVKVAVAHGQMSAGLLEEAMTEFYERRVDVLVSTNIVESGLDIPTANTMIVERADMFGLSQLYQIRGRIGRSKARAYAYLTTPSGKKLTDSATRRLEVLQSLDQLGAGFSVASHDMDIRGAGNLLGEEQSGHVREVGIELYQEMLEDAVAQMRTGEGADLPDQWSPQINIGAAVLIPEAYVPDLNVRMALYRRLASIDDARDIEG